MFTPSPHPNPEALLCTLWILQGYMSHTFNMAYTVYNQTPLSLKVPVLDGQLPSQWLHRSILKTPRFYMARVEFKPIPVLPPGFQISEMGIINYTTSPPSISSSSVFPVPLLSLTPTVNWLPSPGRLKNTKWIATWFQGSSQSFSWVPSEQHKNCGWLTKLSNSRVSCKTRTSMISDLKETWEIPPAITWGSLFLISFRNIFINIYMCTHPAYNTELGKIASIIS